VEDPVSPGIQKGMKPVRSEGLEGVIPRVERGEGVELQEKRTPLGYQKERVWGAFVCGTWERGGVTEETKSRKK